MTKRAERARGVTHLGQHVDRHSEQFAQALVEAGRAEPVQLRSRRRGVVGGEASTEAVAQEGVDCSHAQRSGLARLLDLLLVLEQPGQLGGGEVRVERKTAERADLLLRCAHPVEHLLRALVLPDDDRAERRAGLGVPREHRLALVVEPARHHLVVGGPEQLRNGLHDPPQDLLAILLDPSGTRMGVHLVPSRLPHRMEAFVEQCSLDAGGALVDSEKKHGAYYHSGAPSG
jgi:hypothetical protein